jgi:hypothetical protein
MEDLGIDTLGKACVLRFEMEPGVITLRVTSEGAFKGKDLR